MNISKEMQYNVERLKSLGFTVWTFKTNREAIKQIFVEDKIGRLFTIEEDYFGFIKASSVHKPNRTTGTGGDFGLFDFDNIESYFGEPNFFSAKMRMASKKWKNMQEKIDSCKALEYYKL